jgi:cysteine desulfurase
MNRVYLDNCLTTQPDPRVVSAMLPYLTDRYFLPGNFISTGSTAKKDIARYKSIIATSLNARPDEIHLTSGGTSANNIGIKGYILENSENGHHLICSVVDYPDILTNAAFFEESGFEVTYLDADHDGYIDLEQLKSAIRPDTICVLTTLVNHVLGTIQPIKKISEIIRASNPKTRLFVDAAQAYGRMPIDVVTMDIDMLSVSSHKIHGPQGAGALFIKKGIKIAQTKHGIARIDEFDTGGTSMANLAGFATAVEIAFSDLDTSISYLQNLQKHLYDGIVANIGTVPLNGPPLGERICFNLNISITDVEGEALTMLLDLANITVATGSACASQGLQPNYILMATGRSFEESHGSMKFTLSRMNTIDEIDYTIEKFTAAVLKLKKFTALPQNP